MTETLFANVRVFDGTGRAPYAGHVLVRGNRIVTVTDGPEPAVSPETRRIDGAGRFLMPGLIEPHGHISFTNGRSNEFTYLPPEEHMLETVENARICLESGYTSVFSAASAKPRLDIVLKRWIEAGRAPGPRYLACSPELTVAGGLGDTNLLHLPYNDRTTFSLIMNGAEEFRRTCRTLAREGVDTFKIHLSGDLGASSAPSEQTPMNEDELGAIIEVARAREIRTVCHARSATSVMMALKYGINVINHANYADGPALDGLEAARDRVVVVPAVGITHAIAYSEGRWGIPPIRAHAFQEELEATIVTVQQLRKRGVRVLPGGDYGFVYTPHGTYARDLWLFVELFGFTPTEALVAATRDAAVVMDKEGELGLIKEGTLADILLVDGDPTVDIEVLQDRNRIVAIMKDGTFYKSPAQSAAKARAA